MTLPIIQDYEYRGRVGRRVVGGISWYDVWKTARGIFIYVQFFWTYRVEFLLFSRVGVTPARWPKIVIVFYLKITII